jgi:excisionase family DNA binding protein
MTDRTDRLLTAAEMAEWLSVAPETLLEWVRAGRIPALRVGRKTIRFRLEDVLDALRGDRGEKEVPRG